MRPKQKRLLAIKQREEALKAAEAPTEQKEASVEAEPEVSPKTKLSKEPEKTEKKDTPSKAKMPPEK